MRILRQKQYWLEHFNDAKYEEYRKKINDEFGKLEFYEGPHEYYLNGRKLDCVSDVTHIFKQPFDAESASYNTWRAHFNDESSIYYQKTQEEIKVMWKENSERACKQGSERHEFAESCFYFMSAQYDKILPDFRDRLITDEEGLGFRADLAKEEAVVRVYEDFPDYMIPILAENKIFNITDDYAYAGTFDILFYFEAELAGMKPERSGFYVLDWKTNKDLYNWKGQYMVAPFDGYEQMDVNVYKLQLSLYQLAIEKLGFKVIMRELFWLRPTGNYEKVKLEDLSKRLDEALKASFWLHFTK